MPSPETPSDTCDVVVMGGGPAGSTCATLLAKAGRSVLVLEKEKFPRHHIGESLLPESYWVFERIGVLDKMRSSAHTRKYSVAFASPEGRESKPFYFYETNPHECSQTWQIVRSEFDHMLLDHSAESGACVLQQATVRDVLFEGDRAVGVRYRDPAGVEREVRCKVVVDATGQGAFLSNKLGCRVRDPHLKKAAVYSYFKGAERLPGEDGGATLVLRTKEGNGWFWYIPLRDDVTSVGVVADPDYLVKGRGKDLQKIFDEEIERCEAVRRRVRREGATQCDGMYTANDYSYRSLRISGPGWVMIGDAWGFLDPIYSSGVMIALSSACFAADAIEEAFATGDLSGERLGAFEPKLRQGLESMRKLVYAFYTEGFRFSDFLKKYPDYRLHVIELLRGNFYKEGVDEVYGPMADFFTVPEPVGGEVAAAG